MLRANWRIRPNGTIKNVLFLENTCLERREVGLRQCYGLAELYVF